MTKSKLLYVCMECEYESTQWMGKCNHCNSWNSFEEKLTNSKPIKKLESSKPVRLIDVEKPRVNLLKSKLTFFNDLLGGGFEYGSIILLGGSPGVGKSTLAIEILKSLSEDELEKILYVSGEETPSQVACRFKRIGLCRNDINLFSEANWSLIKDELKSKKNKVVVLDSIQTLYTEDSLGSFGSISQIKSIIFELLEVAKKLNILVLVIGQVNKEGGFAGPKVLEHMVDVSLFIKQIQGENLYSLIVNKNRFGKTTNKLFYKHRDNGLEFVHSDQVYKSKINSNYKDGCTVSCVDNNGECELIEIQSLVSIKRGQRNLSYEYDNKRLNILIALMEKYLDISFMDKEVFINIIAENNFNIKKIDLATIVSIYSSYKNIQLKNNHIFIGEVGLNGEVMERREDELMTKLLGDSRVEKLISNTNSKSSKHQKIKFISEIEGIFG